MSFNHGLPSTAAIILAGGSGTRLGRSDKLNKVYLPLAEQPVAAWSLRSLGRHPLINKIVFVIRHGDESEAEHAVHSAEISCPVDIVFGGATRAESEASGVKQLISSDTSDELDAVLFHDAARPFVSSTLIDRLLQAVTSEEAVIPGLRVPKNIIYFREPYFATPISNAELHTWRRVQTPQVFKVNHVFHAFNMMNGELRNARDTAELVKRTGGPAAYVVDGEESNHKITTTKDWEWAKRYAETLINLP